MDYHAASPLERANGARGRLGVRGSACYGGSGPGVAVELHVSAPPRGGSRSGGGRSGPGVAVESHAGSPPCSSAASRARAVQVQVLLSSCIAGSPRSGAVKSPGMGGGGQVQLSLASRKALHLLSSRGRSGAGSGQIQVLLGPAALWVTPFLVATAGGDRSAVIRGAARPITGPRVDKRRRTAPGAYPSGGVLRATSSRPEGRPTVDAGGGPAIVPRGTSPVRQSGRCSW